jgi:malate synthase
VRADKQREVRAGHDGSWVAHPALVAVAMQQYDTFMPQCNQLFRCARARACGAQGPCAPSALCACCSPRAARWCHLQRQRRASATGKRTHARHCATHAPHFALHRRREDVRISAADLLNIKGMPGSITEAGVRGNLHVALAYMDSWLR